MFKLMAIKAKKAIGHRPMQEKTLTLRKTNELWAK